jgi:3alpha(or 20beta)-hydroxysteroid dehydrogenase
MSEGRLAGKVALITGGARGQGAEEGRLFAAEGATVVLADVLDTEGEATAASIDGAAYEHLDVGSPDDWNRVVDGIMDRHGRLDVLVNNAGIDLIRPLIDTTLEEYERLVTVNQTGTFLGMTTVARTLRDAGLPGSIVNISSVAGLEGVKHHGAYSGTKFAVTGLTRAAAKEWGRYGIRVNSVHPGFIETPMTEGVRVVTDPTLRAKLERAIPLGRLGQSADIAGMVLFLASDEAAYCTGQAFVVDGGVHP